MSVSNVCAQLTADPSILISAFHNQLTADRTQAVPAINHTKLSILWCNGRVEAFFLGTVTIHCDINTLIIEYHTDYLEVTVKRTTNHHSSQYKIERDLEAN